MSGEQWKRTIGKRVADRRAALGYTQTEFARICGLSQSNISNLERGQHAISAETLRRVAIGLGVSTDWLLQIEEKEKA